MPLSPAFLSWPAAGLGPPPSRVRPPIPPAGQVNSQARGWVGSRPPQVPGWASPLELGIPSRLAGVLAGRFWGPAVSVRDIAGIRANRCQCVYQNWATCWPGQHCSTNIKYMYLNLCMYPDKYSLLTDRKIVEVFSMTQVARKASQ